MKVYEILAFKISFFYTYITSQTAKRGDKHYPRVRQSYTKENCLTGAQLDEGKDEGSTEGHCKDEKAVSTGLCYTTERVTGRSFKASRMGTTKIQVARGNPR